jgi:hypothetical protein
MVGVPHTQSNSGTMFFVPWVTREPTVFCLSQSMRLPEDLVHVFHSECYQGNIVLYVSYIIPDVTRISCTSPTGLQGNHVLNVRVCCME